MAATMSDSLLDDADKLARAAELLRLSADAMHDARSRLLAKGAITSQQFRANVVSETALRTQVGEMVLAALKTVVEGAVASQADLEQAIQGATATIQQLADIRHGLAIVAALIGLATAIAAMQPVPIVTALVALEKTATA